MTDSSGRPSALSRRAVLAGSVAGLGAAVAFATPAAAAPDYTVIPQLPGEISRLDTVLSRTGKKPYEVIDVSISGDRTRLFVPHSARPSLTTGRGFLWYYHARGGNHTALSNAFAYTADQAVDRGLVSICPTYGGTLWASPTAITLQNRAVSWVTGLWKVSVSFLRANSGGGPLMIWAYGKRLVPNIRGAYLCSGTYDMEEKARRDPDNVMQAYGNDTALIAETNPARLPQSVWSGARLRITGSTDDTIVPFDRHGIALHERARPVAKESSVVHHSGEGTATGHVFPSFTNKDMLDTFQRWLSEGPATTTPPPTAPALPGAGTYQNGAAAISTVGTWTTLSSTSDSGGSISYSTSTDASASLTFSGTSVRWISRTSSTSGINHVVVDGVRVASVDRYSATTGYARTVFSSGSLPKGKHTITISRGTTRNPAATGGSLVLDAFVVTA